MPDKEDFLRDDESGESGAWHAYAAGAAAAASITHRNKKPSPSAWLASV